MVLSLSVLLGGCTGQSTGELRAVTPLPANLSATPAPPTATPDLAASSPSGPTATAAATPTPLNVNLPAGSALAIAEATDAALQPTPRRQLTFDERPVRLTFDEFYDGYNVRTGLVLSDKLLSLDGQEVVIEGYMAPPLKAELDWFVLTRIRLSDIALIYLTNDTIRPTEKPLRLHGRLEVGPAVDPETGMVSIVRIYATKLETL
jgi:hypothetical protein